MGTYGLYGIAPQSVQQSPLGCFCHNLCAAPPVGRSARQAGRLRHLENTAETASGTVDDIRMGTETQH